MATIVMVFAGEYDLTHQSQVRAEFDALRDENHLILDMSAVTFADRGCDRLTIVRAAPIVKKVFALLYIFTFARVVASLDEALPNGSNPVIVQRACSGDNPAPRRAVRVLKTESPTPAWISSVLTAAGV
jgi:hypothetical protein